MSYNQTGNSSSDPKWVALCLSTLEAIGGSRALAVAIILRYDGIDGLSQLSNPDPMDYESPVAFSRDWAGHRFLAKCDFLSSTIDKKAVARRAFIEAELQCQRTNRRLQSAIVGRAGRIFRLARKMIADLLGDDPFKIVSFDDPGWGTGSTSSCKGRFTQVQNKIDAIADHTASLTSYVPALSELWWFPRGGSNTVNWNIVSTVPKSYKTDRTIAIEPTVNSSLQRSVGVALRDRLLMWGVNTRDQSRNQRLAKRGARFGTHSTIDLSMASDTVSRELIPLLLPEKWARLLAILRSNFYKFENELDSEPVLYQKHSSMGNGYTFELETLVFSAIVRASHHLLLEGPAKDSWAVYGDDMVCVTRCDPYVRGTLRTLGFLVNHEKSFRTGCFRESCGEEYFRGLRCTPFYARKWSKTSYIWAFALANYIRGGNASSWLEARKAWLSVFTSTPKSWRLCGPAVMSDTHFHVNEGESSHVVYGVRAGRLGFHWQAWHFKAATRSSDTVGGFLECMRNLGERQYLSPVVCLAESPEVFCNTARRAGKWVKVWFFSEDYHPVVNL